jgi:hypothetical protein
MVIFDKRKDHGVVDFAKDNIPAKTPLPNRHAELLPIKRDQPHFLRELFRVEAHRR